MDIAKAFTYIFDDPDWVTKIAITALVGLGSSLVVILVGFVFVAALIGYTIELLENVRDGMEYPLPNWDDFGAKMTTGFGVLGAYLVYAIPGLILSCIFLLPVGLMGENGAEAISGAILCLYVPVFLIYIVAVGLFLSVGLVRYAETRQMGEFFKFAAIWDTIKRNGSLTGQWILFTILANLVISAVGSVIPFVGTIIALGFQTPVQGHLTGQYAALLDGGKLKRKRS